MGVLEDNKFNPETGQGWSMGDPFRPGVSGDTGAGLAGVMGGEVPVPGGSFGRMQQRSRTPYGARWSAKGMLGSATGDVSRHRSFIDPQGFVAINPRTEKIGSLQEDYGRTPAVNPEVLNRIFAGMAANQATMAGAGVRPGAVPPMNAVQAARGLGGSYVPPGGGTNPRNNVLNVYPGAQPQGGQGMPPANQMPSQPQQDPNTLYRQGAQPGVK